MMHRRLLPALLLSFPAMAQAPDADPAAARASNLFGLDLYARFAKGEGNFAFSPYSVASALAMVYTGAAGDTAAEMKNALYLPAEPAPDVAHESLRRRLLAASGREAELAVANALWGQKDTSFQASFIGALRDRFGALLPFAVNKTIYTVSADPRRIVDHERTAGELAQILHVSPEDIVAKLRKENDPYEVIATKVADDVADAIKQKKFAGIFLEPQHARHYPYERSGSHISGFLGIRGDDRVGQYGLEGFYEQVLAESDVEKLILSIDPHIQFTIEEELKNVIEKWGAAGGSAIVMEPSTGRILGMARAPAYDPNEYAKEKDVSVFSNAAVSSQLELGSVFKPITMAIGLNEKAVRPDTTYEDTGVVSIGGYSIRNFDNEAHGVQTMTQVLEQSLNTGVVFVQKKIPKDTMHAYIKNFGFGERTGIDLQGEVAGDIRNLNTGRDLEFATASFGQGISVTPIQMITAIAAIANKGALMKPHVVDKKIFRDGTEISQEATTVRSVIAPATAETLTKMLVSVVENGYDKAKVRGYFVAGKTGTAQIPDPNGKGYLDDATIHTFVGYAPAYHPQFAVLLSIDRPHGVRFASSSLAPVFSSVMSYLLTYYEIPPDFK